jgi:rod shape-determining protein MreD
MIKLLPRYIINFIVLVLIQVFILNNIQLGGFVNPYFYVLFILILPFETPNWLLLIIALFLGLTIDLFSNTLGMHSSATVFMAFLRPHVLKIISPRDGYESETLPQLRFYGAAWYLRYSFILVFSHHLFLFYIEVFKLSNFFATFARVILNTIFTLILILISQYFFRKDTRR